MSRAGRRVGDAMVTCPKIHDPGTSVTQIRALFDDDHVHMALVVGPERRLVTAVERGDLGADVPGSTPVAEVGSLLGRTVGPSEALDVVTPVLLRTGRRRLAVVDDSGRLLGLLCLKRDGAGYCSDEGVRARADEGSPVAVRPGRST